jgi:hypothetical protein
MPPEASNVTVPPPHCPFRGACSEEDRYMGAMARYRVQSSRMLRYHERLKAITGGRSHESDSEGHADDVYAFFLNCYHLKDWLANDQSFPSSRCEVEAFVNDNSALRICADICNASKHLIVTKERSCEHPVLGKRDIRLKPGSSAPQISMRFTVDTTSGPLDALCLADECVGLWRQFMARFGASI